MFLERTITGTGGTARAALRYVLLLFLAGGLLLFTSGCVYFNLYYNIKNTYKEAEKAPLMPDGKTSRQADQKYDKVIEKCQQIIVQHPDSKYVDDSVLLIGKSHFAKGEYTLAITKFEELAENFPESKLNTEGQLYLGKSYLAEEKPANAASVLTTLYESEPRTNLADRILYYLGIALIRIGDIESAAGYLETLAKRYPNSELRLEADLEMADLYTQSGDYERALELYTKLAGARTSSVNKIRYLNRLSEVYVKMGDYDKAMRVMADLRRSILDDETLANQMLLESEALLGKGQLEGAIDSYESVAARFPRSKYAAEAYFRLGDIYQTRLDSLDLARQSYDEVPKQFANSPFAVESVMRSSSIVKFQRLNASLAAGESQDQSGVQFELAETELFQFKNTEKALAGYLGVLTDYPESDFAPKAAYAIAYIYDKLLNDQPKAQRFYLRIVREYPYSQQAGYARTYLGITVPEVLEEPQSSSVDQ